MHWFIAKIVYEIICGNGAHCPQFDEQLRLIAAPDYQDALKTATHIGQTECLSFENQQKNLVQWKFLEVSELMMLHPLLHGAELYSCIREIDHADGYRNMISNRAKQLHQNLPNAYHTF